MLKKLSPHTPKATIVELLIVIVVIAILATITVVAYSGIQASAGAVVLKSDLNQAQTQLELDRIDNSTYPATESGLPKSSAQTTSTPSRTMTIV
jgi:general secretion pathway protein G